MRISSTFSVYIVRNLLKNLFYIFLAFAFLGFIIELLELIREAQGKKILLSQMLRMTFYKVPFLTFSFFPFIFLFSSIMTFTKMNNNYEFIAMKCAGTSIWSICLPIAIAVVVLSWIILFIFQPLSAVLLDSNRILGTKYLGYVAKRVSIQANGIWLYDQANSNNDHKIISINHIDKGDILTKVAVYCSGNNNDFTTSFFADSAIIKNHNLILANVYQYSPSNEPVFSKELTLLTNIADEQIQQNIPHPDIIPFWNLKNFIAQAKQSGLSTLRHELYYQSMMASPLLYLSLVFIALTCSINLPRKGRMGTVFILGGGIGIVIFFIDKITNVMALTGTLPITVAAIIPGTIYFLISAAMLIHYEEG